MPPDVLSNQHSMQTPRVPGWLSRALVAVTLLAVLGSGSAHATKRKPPAAPAPPPILRFPDTVSDSLLTDLTQAGHVSTDLPPDPEQWKRWGRAAPDDQVLAVRAICDALAHARLPIDLSAMVLAIARVESGFNPFSENPDSTACGLFQFVEGTWEMYMPSRQACFDPYVNAWAGVSISAASTSAGCTMRASCCRACPTSCSGRSTSSACCTRTTTTARAPSTPPSAAR